MRIKREMSFKLCKVATLKGELIKINNVTKLNLFFYSTFPTGDT